MKKKRLFAGLLVISTILTLSGCGAAMSDKMTESFDMVTNSSGAMRPSMDMEYAENDYAMEESVKEVYDGAGMNSGSTASKTQGESVKESAAATDRKLIKTVDMNVETQEFDELVACVEQQVKALGGYIENMELYNGRSYYSYKSGARNANIIIRIPQAKLDAFLGEISGISNVISRSESVKDITLTYVDLDSHKKALIAEQDRLLQLMERAETIDELITIESRLSDLRYQIQSMESQLRTYDNKVDYSTINLYINEVEVFTPVEEETTWERISSGFVENLKSIKDGFVELVIWFTVSVPYLLIWAVIIIVAVLIVRRIIKKNRKKRGAAVQTQYQVPYAGALQQMNPTQNTGGENPPQN